MFRSRKGSYIVEAAILYPIIVVVTIMMFIVFVYFYIHTENTYNMSHDCRIEAGLMSGTVIYGDRSKSNPESNIDICRVGLSKKVIIHNRATLVNNIIYEYVQDLGYSVEHSVVNEAELIWDLDVIKKLITG